MINGALLIAPIKKKSCIPNIRQQEKHLSKKMSNFKQGAAARYNMILSNDLMSTVDIDIWRIIWALKVAPIHHFFYCTHTTVNKKDVAEVSYHILIEMGSFKSKLRLKLVLINWALQLTLSDITMIQYS